jgi:hypothetical protein
MKASELLDLIIKAAEDEGDSVKVLRGSRGSYLIEVGDDQILIQDN